MCANASQTMNVSPISRTLRALCAPLDRTRLELGEEHLPLEVSSDEDESRSGSPPRRAHPLLGTLAELVGAVYRLERLLVKRPKLALMNGGGEMGACRMGGKRGYATCLQPPAAADAQRPFGAVDLRMLAARILVVELRLPEEPTRENGKGGGGLHRGGSTVGFTPWGLHRGGYTPWGLHRGG